MLFDYLKFPEPLEEQAKEFLNKPRQIGIQWAQDRIMIFLDFRKQSKEVCVGKQHNLSGRKRVSVHVFIEIRYYLEKSTQPFAFS